MTAADRQRRRRLRRRLGIHKVEVEVSAQTRAALIEDGYLKEWDEDDKLAVQQALQRRTDEIGRHAVTGSENEAA